MGYQSNKNLIFYKPFWEKNLIVHTINRLVRIKEKMREDQRAQKTRKTKILKCLGLSFFLKLQPIFLVVKTTAKGSKAKGTTSYNQSHGKTIQEVSHSAATEQPTAAATRGRGYSKATTTHGSSNQVHGQAASNNSK